MSYFIVISFPLGTAKKSCFELSTKEDAREVDEAIALLEAQEEEEAEVVEVEVEAEVVQEAKVEVKRKKPSESKIEIEQVHILN